MFSADSELGMPSHPLMTVPPSFQIFLRVFSLTLRADL
jgi:hypothetical protein